MVDFRKNRGAVVGATIVGSQTLTFDATLREQFDWQADVTEHEVEDGVNVTDHVRPKPREFTLEVIASATPVGSAPESDQRDREIRAALIRMWEAAELVTVSCEIGVYENCAIVSVSEALSPSSTLVAMPSVQFRQLRLVERRTVTLPPDESVNRRIQPEQNRGDQPPDSTTATSAWASAAAEQAILGARDQGSFAFRATTSDAEALGVFGLQP